MKKLNLNESFISRIWLDNKYYYNLKTTDGRPIEVISYGTLNTDSGADFKDALIKIGDRVFEGDVEIHKTFKDWEIHKHFADGKYNKVILHVVFWGDKFDYLNKTVNTIFEEIPTIVLSHFLTDSIHNIWKDIINHPLPSFKLPCSSYTKTLNDSFKKNFLKKLGLTRLSYRSNRIRSRKNELDIEYIENPDLVWRKLLFEFTCESLGFSKNKEQFLKFSKYLDFKLLAPQRYSIKTLESLFFGIAGFLKDTETNDKYTLSLKKNWIKLNQTFGRAVMNVAEWVFFRLRPNNFPTLRLAYAASLCYEILYNNFFEKIVNFFNRDNILCEKLVKILVEITPSLYWKTHYHLGKSSNRNFNPLGKSRSIEIIINVLLPLLFLYSKSSENQLLYNKVVNFYFSLKHIENNSIIRVMKKQLNVRTNFTIEAQGIIHLHNNFCIKQLCDKCDIGKQVFINNKVSETLKIILY
ncbi:MAG: DUF2851 family protein [Ignavibacteria bacterium]